MTQSSKWKIIGALVFVLVMVSSPVASAVAVPALSGATDGNFDDNGTQSEIVSYIPANEQSVSDRNSSSSTSDSVSSSDSAQTLESGIVREGKLTSAVQREIVQSQGTSSDKIPVIVVLEKQPNDLLDLESLSSATGPDQLKQFANQQQAPLLDYLERQRQLGQVDDIRSYWLRNGIAVQASPETIISLTSSSRVDQIIYDQEVEALDDSSNSTIDQLRERLSKYGNVSAEPEGFERVSTGDRAWSVEYVGADDVQDRGVTGEGVNVSVVDTGIDSNHPALRNQTILWKDFVNSSNSEPVDPYGHGTHVAGTIAGQPDAKYAVGVAPDANLFGARVLDSSGSGRLSDVLTAFEWSANHSADIVSASLGVSPYVDIYAGNPSSIRSGESSTSKFRVNQSTEEFTFSDNVTVSLDGFEPAYTLVFVEPTAENGTSIVEDGQNQSRVMRNLTVGLENPAGDRSLEQYEASWVMQGDLPDEIGLWKFKPASSRTLEAGNWTLNVTNNHGTNISYQYEVIPIYPTNGSDEMARFVDNLATTQDVIPVISAGNSGGVLGNRTLGSPGAAEEAITVGATGYKTNDVAWFSSRGPVDYGANTRPGVDLIAPGTDILSSVPAHLTYSGEYRDAYANWDGTSMAAPHVSGTAALLLDADSSLNRTQVLEILKSSAQEVPGGENAVGSGALDTWAAVNETINLGARTPQSESGVHELFAGRSGTGEKYHTDVQLDPVLDPSDDAGDAPDIWAASADIVDRFELVTYNRTPKNATFDIYIDVDRNDTTGDMNERGAEYLIRANRTFSGGIYGLELSSLEYDTLNNTYVPTTKVSASSPGDVQGNFIEFHDIDFTNRPDSAPFEWHVKSETPSSGDMDAMPNIGQQSYHSKVNITGLAVAWNATDGGPSVNEPVNMTLYNTSNDSVVERVTVRTDGDGFARADFKVTGLAYWESPYEHYTIDIEDQHGNIVTQDIDIDNTPIKYKLVDITSESETKTGDIGNFTVEDRDYDVRRNTSVQFNIPIYDKNNETLTPYQGAASIEIVTDDQKIIRDRLTIDDGVLRTTLDLANLTFDDSGHGYADVQVALEGDYKNATETAWGGDINVGSDYVKTYLAPVTTVTKPRTPANLSFQNVVNGERVNSDTEPANASLEQRTYWITDRHVAAFYQELPKSTVNKIKDLRTTAESPASPSIKLSERDRDAIHEAQQNLLETQGIDIEVTTDVVSPTQRGIGTFGVTPPEDARIGLTFAEANASEVNASYAQGTGSVVFVDDRLRQFNRKQTQPEEETRYDLDVYTSWDHHQEGDFMVPNDSITAHVALYDRESESLVDGANVRLYSTPGTGNVTSVTTNENEYVSVEIPAPDIHWPTSSYDERDQQIIGIAEGYNTADGSALFEEEVAYGSVWRISEDSNSVESGTVVDPDLMYYNGTLQATLDYWNESDWSQANATRTLMKIGSPDTNYDTRRDVNISFVDPRSDRTSVKYNFSESVPPEERREYEVEAMTADMDWDWGESAFVNGVRAQVHGPESLYSGQSSTVKVTFEDRNGQSVTGATVVWEYFEINSTAEEPSQTSLSQTQGQPSQLDGDTQIGTTDSNGNVTFEVHAPSLESEKDVKQDLQYRIGIATDNLSYPFVESGRFEVVDTPPVNVTGRLLLNDSTSPATQDLVVAARMDGSTPEVVAENVTNSTGYFSLSVQNNTYYEFWYAQYDETTQSFAEHDDTVNLWPLDEFTVTGDHEIGSVTLPKGHNVNLTVIDEDGNPVESAEVKYILKNDATGSEFEVPPGSTWIQTQEDGLMKMANSSRPGVDLRGNVTFQVQPPEGEKGWVDTTYEKSVEVTESKDLNVTIKRSSSIVTGRIIGANGEPRANETVWAYPSKEADRDTEPAVTKYTDANGQFELVLPNGVEYNLTYYQGQATENTTERLDWISSNNFPRDGSPDIYALMSINVTSETNLTDIQLPNAHALNISVQNESGMPVNYSEVTIYHENNDSKAGWIQLTREDGQIYPNGSHPGLEVDGEIGVRVAPPENNPRYVQTTYFKNLTVTNDTNARFDLQEREKIPTVALETGSTAINATTSLNLTLSSAPEGLSGYKINVSVDNETVAGFVNASYPSSSNFTNTSIHNDGAKITLKALANETSAGASNISLGSVKLKGLVEGETNLSVDVVQMDPDGPGDTINPDEKGATINVTVVAQVCYEPGCDTPTDPDGDGLYEDIDGDGRFGFNDVVVFFNQWDAKEIQSHPSAYDFNGNGGIDFDDIVTLFEEV